MVRQLQVTTQGPNIIETWNIREGGHDYNITLQATNNDHFDRFFNRIGRNEFVKKIAYFNSFINVPDHGFQPVTTICINPERDGYDAEFHTLTLANPSAITHEMGHALFAAIEPGMFKKNAAMFGGPLNLLNVPEISDELKKIFCIFLIHRRYLFIKDEKYDQIPNSGHPHDSLDEFMASAFHVYHDYPDALAATMTEPGDAESQSALRMLCGYLSDTFRQLGIRRNQFQANWTEMLGSVTDTSLFRQLIDEYKEADKRVTDCKQAKTSFEYRNLESQRKSVSYGIIHMAKKLGLNTVLSFTKDLNPGDQAEMIQILADHYDTRMPEGFHLEDIVAQLDLNNPLQLVFLKKMTPYMISFITDYLGRKGRHEEAGIIFRSLPIILRIKVDLKMQEGNPSLFKAVMTSV